MHFVEAVNSGTFILLIISRKTVITPGWWRRRRFGRDIRSTISNADVQRRETGWRRWWGGGSAQRFNFCDSQWTQIECLLRAPGYWFGLWRSLKQIYGVLLRQYPRPAPINPHPVAIKLPRAPSSPSLVISVLYYNSVRGEQLPYTGLLLSWWIP